jgi:hypothetical protein
LNKISPPGAQMHHFGDKNAPDSSLQQSPALRLVVEFKLAKKRQIN